MGIPRLFKKLSSSSISGTAIITNITRPTDAYMLAIDANSVIYGSEAKIKSAINMFRRLELQLLYERNTKRNTSIKVPSTLLQQRQQYGITLDQSITTPQQLTKAFDDHFTLAYLNRLITDDAINMYKSLVELTTNLKLLYIVFDGTPSKAKMVEQKKRRYIGAITETFIKTSLLPSYQSYLTQLPNYEYYNEAHATAWNKGNITPGTNFMYNIARQLAQAFQVPEFQHIKVVISGMEEIGEAEKKIVNYIETHYTNEQVIVYSPDADVIFLCQLLHIPNVAMLRHDQEKSSHGSKVYDMIDIPVLKRLLAEYVIQGINSKRAHLNTDGNSDQPTRALVLTPAMIHSINNDIVFLSTVFGNDFLQRMETFDVGNFDLLLDIYLNTMIEQGSDVTFLVLGQRDNYKINYKFLQDIIKNMLPYEAKFIENNHLYNVFMNYNQIEYVFNPIKLKNEDDVERNINQLKTNYNKLKTALMSRDQATIDDLFHTSHFAMQLKRSINIPNAANLTNDQLIQDIKQFYRDIKSFPRLDLDTRKYSSSSNNPRHSKRIEKFNGNKYKIEAYKFENMLDDYHHKFNASRLKLSPKDIPNYYSKYFHDCTIDEICFEYLLGFVWVFEYYYNKQDYVSTWYYPFERSPLLRDVYKFMVTHSAYVTDVYEALGQFEVADISKFFNPVEQLLYVTPINESNAALLPKVILKNFNEISDELDAQSVMVFTDIAPIVQEMTKPKCDDSVIDCRSISYFNKCIMPDVQVVGADDDDIFRDVVRRYASGDEEYERKAKSVMPNHAF